MSDSPAVPDDSLSLPGGGAMPLLGFGTWQLGADTADAVATALAAGYRHLDTATMYRNEDGVGRALADSGLPRGEVFVTTKVTPRHHGREREILSESLRMLETDRVDLWLVHAPSDRATNESLWRSFVEAQRDGLTTDIGVSNFTAGQIDALADATGVLPAVNQIEWSPLLHDPAVVEEYRERGVVLEGYSGLRGGVLDHAVVTGIADRVGRTPAQVVLRWHLQHGIVAIPRSRRPDRIRANADLAGFELSADDVAALDGLGAAR
jgi:diketogulonate reductase-like aldo/keto reductase